MLNAFLKSLPYTVHTNRELGLMLSWEKPFAAFCDAKGQYPALVMRYLRLFDRQVACGHFVRRDHFESAGPYELHRIMFALPSEVWRFDAYNNLWQSPRWGEEEERREGELLGYADWMNDHFLAIKFG